MHPRCYHRDRRRDDRGHHQDDRGHLHRVLRREHLRDAGIQHPRDERRVRRYAPGTARWDGRDRRDDLRHQHLHRGEALQDEAQPDAVRRDGACPEPTRTGCYRDAVRQDGACPEPTRTGYYRDAVRQAWPHRRQRHPQRVRRARQVQPAQQQPERRVQQAPRELQEPRPKRGPRGPQVQQVRQQVPLHQRRGVRPVVNVRRRVRTIRKPGWQQAQCLPLPGLPSACAQRGVRRSTTHP